MEENEKDFNEKDFEDTTPAVPNTSSGKLSTRTYEATLHGLPRRRPFLAAFFSFVPGLGNIYNGLYARGFSIFAIMWLLLSFTIAEGGDNGPFTVPCMIFLMLFNILDAYRQALLINVGGITDLGISDLPHLEKLAGSALIPGVVMALVGVYGAFKVYLNTDFGWIFQHWPVPVMLFGGWLTWQALRAQSENAALRPQEAEGI